MEKWRKIQFRIAVGIGLLSLVAFSYQNCSSYAPLGYTSSSSISGTIHNTTLITNAISAGANFTCSINGSGNQNVYCWGDGNNGQLGNGTASVNTTAIPAGALIAPAVKVVAGGLVACALTNTGNVECWGDDTAGELGNTGVVGGQSDAPVEVSLAYPAVDVAASFNAVCAVLQTGIIECYGDNTYGELGVGSQGNNSSSAVFVDGITNAVAIVGGYAHFCALLITGQVECWGANTEGELGNEAGGADQDSPVFMAGFTGTPKTLYAGSLDTCGINTAGALICYGDNSRGEMGNNSESTNSDPVPWGYTNPTFNSGVTSVSVGGPYVPAGGTQNWPFICALKSGNVWCAGDNTYWELGNQTYNGNANYIIPVEVQNSTGSTYLSGVTQVATGLGHACGYINATTIWCWGNDSWGELGNNTQSFPAQQALPVQVVFQQ